MRAGTIRQARIAFDLDGTLALDTPANLMRTKYSDRGHDKMERQCLIHSNFRADILRYCPAIVGVLLTVAANGGAFASTPARTPATTQAQKVVPDKANTPVLNILKALQHRGSTLHNFQAHLVVQVHHLRTDEKDMNIGHIWYRRSNGKTEFDIRFNMLVVDGAIAKRHADHDIVFDGRWLIDRNGSAKIFRKIEIAPPGKKFNPLRLGQGPIPIPIGQDPVEVEREFHVRLLHDKKMPANTVGLQLLPRDKAAFTFLEVDFWLDTKTWLPIKIIRIDPDGTPTTALLTKMVINRPMHHDFHLAAPGAGWTVQVKRYRQN